MIRAVAHAPDREVVILGITYENMARLSAGEPILVRCSDPPPDGLGLVGAPDIAIIAGKDEDTIAVQLRQGGYVNDQTETHDTRPPTPR